jgi:predicted Rossmann fold nucleotide-binding protein DprA/Smf involved in DNA uptake
VLDRLSDGARTLDELARATEIGSAEVAAVLTELELAGLIAAADGVYRRATGRGPPRAVRP